MRYVLTGGSGFVGRHLAAELARLGQETAVIDIVPPAEAAEFCHIDLRDKAALEQFDFREDDLVVQLAANQYHHKVPQGEQAAHDYFFSVNLAGTKNLLSVMEQKGCRRLIFFSTDMTYGKPQYLPVDTAHPQVPFGPYGESKKEAEKLCFAYREKGFDITIFRPRMILGPGRLGILTKLFRLIDLGLPVPLIGDGSNCYQMVSVFDCVQAVLKAAEKGVPGGEYNLGSDSPPTVYELLQGLIKDVGSGSPLLRTPGPLVKKSLALLGAVGLPLMYREQYEIADENYILDISKTVEELGWRPEYDDRRMLFEAYETYRKLKARP